MSAESATGSYSCPRVSRDAFLSRFTIAITSLEIIFKKKKKRKRPLSWEFLGIHLWFGQMEHDHHGAYHQHCLCRYVTQKWTQDTYRWARIAGVAFGSFGSWFTLWEREGEQIWNQDDITAFRNNGNVTSISKFCSVLWLAYRFSVFKLTFESPGSVKIQ